MNFSDIDIKWQRAWFEGRVFEPEHEKKKKFFFTIPYPYVSGTLHVGHGRTYTNGDIIARYKRMNGLNVLWPMAFHITGTPVLAISSKISSGNEDTIKLYKEYVGIYEEDEKKIEKIVKSFSDPWNIVKYFSGKLIQDFKSIGYSLDLSRQFTTGDLEYNRFIEWQFHKYKEKGYLKQGNYPVLYCPKDENAVGEDDIQDADTNPVTKQDFIWGKFKLKDSDLILMAGTTRPDAFYGQTHLWIDPDATYKIVKVGEEKWVVGSEAVNKIKYHYPHYKAEVVGEITSKELMGKWVHGPLVDYDIYIAPGWFIDSNVGSGIVYSALEDPVDLFELKKIHENMDLIKQYNLDEKVIAKLKPISIIKVPGMGENLGEEIGKEFRVKSPNDKKKIDAAKHELNRRVFRKGIMKDNCGACAGMTVQEAQKYLNKKLVEDGEAVMFYETSRDAYCRCGEKIVVAVMDDQWFIDFNAKGWKEKSRECLKKMLIYPEGHRKQFEDVLEWLDKRPCARKRGLGTKLPFNKDWIIESLSDSTIYMAFYTVIKKIRELKIKENELTPEFFDYVFLGKGKWEKKWETVRKEFEYWYPNDLRHTAIAHITNHLSFAIFAHTAIFEKKYWPKGFTLNDMLISEGRKMSKSKGNVVMLNEISRDYGADSFRLYVSSAADFGSVLDFRKKDAGNAKKHLQRFFEFAEKLIEARKNKGKGADTHLTKWMKSIFEKGVKESSKALEEFRVRDYTQIAFYKMFNNFEYFYKKADGKERKEIADELLERWIKLLCPVIPHLCEELWSELGNKKFVSLEKFPKVNKKNVNEKVEDTENYLKGILEDVERIKNLVKIKAKRVVLIVASKEKVKKLSKELKKDGADKVEYMHENIAYLKKNFYKIRDSFRELDEKKIILDGKKFLEQETGLEVIVEEEEKSTNEKRTKAFPNKPAIILEE